MQKPENKKPIFVTLLLIWQIFEITGALLAIPIVYIFGVLFTGDSNTVIDAVMSNIIPAILVIFVLKAALLFAMFKRKRWAVIANLIQNIILVLLSILLLIVAYNHAASYFFFFLYSLLTIGYIYSARLSYFKKPKQTTNL